MGSGLLITGLSETCLLSTFSTRLPSMLFDRPFSGGWTDLYALRELKQKKKRIN